MSFLCHLSVLFDTKTCLHSSVTKCCDVVFPGQLIGNVSSFFCGPQSRLRGLQSVLGFCYFFGNGSLKVAGLHAALGAACLASLASGSDVRVQEQGQFSLPDG